MSLDQFQRFIIRPKFQGIVPTEHDPMALVEWLRLNFDRDQFRLIVTADSLGQYVDLRISETEENVDTFLNCFYSKFSILEDTCYL